MIDLKKSWSFKDKAVADNFDQHVREQLPWYDLVNDMIQHFALHYIPKNGVVYDVGASNGNVGRIIEKILIDRDAKLTSIEESEEMCKAFHAIGILTNQDALEFEFENFDFCTCMLVIMFMPLNKRIAFLRNLYDKLNNGGCILIFDKLEPENGYLGLVNHRLALSMKVSSGVSYTEIIDKELSLSGIQVPLENLLIPTILPSAKVIFKFGEFVGYVICKRDF